MICCSAYVILAGLVVGHLNFFGQGHMTGAILPDQIEEVWWLSWPAFALTHGHNVLSAQWQNYPAGENFGAQGSILTLGIIFLPITKLFGPIVSWNIAIRLALAVSASSMCFVLRRWTNWWPAAFVGGLLYGFSTYAVHYSSDLLFLAFVPLPPVIFLLLHEILVRQRWRPGRTGALLAVLCTLQFFISSEILASTIAMGAVAVALYLLLSRHRLVGRLHYALTAFGYTLGIGLLLLVPPIFYTLAGPQSIKGSLGSPAASSTRYASDLLGAIVPSVQWLTTNGLTSVATTRFPFATALYLGVPLIVALTAFAVFFRRRREILFVGIMALVAYVFSLGPDLRVDGHETPIRLPFLLLQHLPLVQNFVQVRFSLFTALFAAAMFSIGLEELWKLLRRSRAPRWLSPKWRSPRWRVVAATGLSAAIAAIVAIPLIPDNTQPSSKTNIPSFFTSSALDAVPSGSVTLAYPYPDFSGPSLFYQPTHDIMLDQAVAGMRFKLIGGYGWFPSPTGLHGTVSPTVLKPKSVQTMFDRAFYGRGTLPKAHVVADLRVFLRNFDVQNVIVLPEGADPGLVIDNVTAAIGCPVQSDGVFVWFHVREHLRAHLAAPSDSSRGTCAAIPKAVTHLLDPTNDTTLSGSTLLDSTVTDLYKVTKVEYYITGGSQHETPVGTATLTIGGWIARWNTTTVPNGTYAMKSVAFDTGGRSGHGPGVTITVDNGSH
jgi:Bacterial Ig domain